MKKLLYTLLAISIIFSACEKEDDEPSSSGNNISASIVGTWNCIKMEDFRTEGRILSNGTTIIDTTYIFNPNSDPEIASWTFQQNNDLVWDEDGNGSSSYISSSYMITGNILSISTTENSENGPYTETTDWTINTLNNNTLICEIAYEEQWGNNPIYFSNEVNIWTFNK